MSPTHLLLSAFSWPSLFQWSGVSKAFPRSSLAPWPQKQECTPLSWFSVTGVWETCPNKQKNVHCIQSCNICTYTLRNHIIVTTVTRTQVECSKQQINSPTWNCGLRHLADCECLHPPAMFTCNKKVAKNHNPLQQGPSQVSHNFIKSFLSYTVH